MSCAIERLLTNRIMPADKITHAARVWGPAGVLALLITIIYIPSLDLPFVFDDLPNIVLNPAVLAENFADLARVTESPVSASRPLALLSFAVNHWLGGLDVFGFHLFNTLVHILNALLLYFLLPLLPCRFPPESTDSQPNFDRWRLAFWGAALWAVNPVQTQGVTYIVQRMTSMATSFYLAALLVFMAWRRGRLASRWALPLLLGSFILGLACKETILTMPLALVLADLLFFPERFRRNLPIYGGLLLLLILLGFGYLQGNWPDWQATYPNRNFTPLERVMTQWRVVWHYLGLYLLPLPTRLHLTYEMTVSRALFSPWSTFTGLVAMLGTITIALRLRKAYPLAAWGVLFYFLAVAPEASFVNLELAFVHRLYLPSLFLVPAFLDILPRNMVRRLGPLLLVLIALWSFWTITRNDEWQDLERFWGSDVERGDLSARAKNNQASALIDNGRFTEALARIEEGLQLATRDDDLMILLYNRGYTLYYLGKYGEALATFQRTARQFGAFQHNLLFMGLSYLRLGKKEQAVALAEKMLAVPPLLYQGRILQAEILVAEERSGEALKMLKETLAADQDAPIYDRQRLQLEMAEIHLRRQENGEAYRLYMEIVEDYPQNYSVWTMIYRMLVAGGDLGGADKVRKFLESRGVNVNLFPTGAGPVGTQGATVYP